MRSSLKRMSPYILVLVINFYLLPLLMKDTGSAMTLLLMVIPLVSFVCGFVCGINLGFQWLLPLVALVLVLPTPWIFYNESAWIYVVLFPLLVLLGNILGNLFAKRKKGS